MIEFDGLDDTTGWFQETGKSYDVIVSSRTRISRNLAGHKFPCRYFHFSPTADNPDPGQGKTFECCHGALCTTFLDAADQGVDHNNGEDNNGITMFAQKHGQQCSNEKDIDEWTLKLAEEEPCKATSPGLRQGVRPIVIEAG